MFVHPRFDQLNLSTETFNINDLVIRVIVQYIELDNQLLYLRYLIPAAI